MRECYQGDEANHAGTKGVRKRIALTRHSQRLMSSAPLGLIANRVGVRFVFDRLRGRAPALQPNERKTLMYKIIVMVALAVLTGCSTDLTVDINSDTEWSGSFGGRTVEGVGARSVDIPDDHPQCVVVQKQTEGGYLKIQIKADGGILGPSGSDEVSTTAAYGVVSACSGD